MRATLPPPTQQPQTLDPEALLEEKVSACPLLTRGLQLWRDSLWTVAKLVYA